MKVKINFNNRFLYTFITIVGIILISVVVYAYSGNVGHTSDQIDEVDPSVPTSCTVDQVLEWNSTDWDCADASSGSSLPTTCSVNQLLKWDGNSWECADDLSETSFTYTSTDSCDAGDETIASRYESRQCCYPVPGICSSSCCTTTQGDWSDNPTAPTCSYNQVELNNYNNCASIGTSTCTANEETFLCRVYW